MSRDDPNREYLLVVADALGDLCDEVVFVGGSVAGLLLTDPVAEGIRATKDVDAVVEAATLSEYYQVEKRLPALGFTRVDGRPSIVEELSAASDALQNFVRRHFRILLSQPALENYLPGLLTDENRAGIVLSRLGSMAA